MNRDKIDGLVIDDAAMLSLDKLVDCIAAGDDRYSSKRGRALTKHKNRADFLSLARKLTVSNVRRPHRRTLNLV